MTSSTPDNPTILTWNTVGQIDAQDGGLHALDGQALLDHVLGSVVVRDQGALSPDLEILRTCSWTKT